VDADGVALAAIQGLNQKLEHQLEQKETEITELKQTVSELKEVINAMNHKLNGGAK
jgi:predicted  nucleic acid-binding Zn-ribbon protein